MAHGAPGVVGVLARFVEAGVERARSRRLLEAAVAPLLRAPAPGRSPRDAGRREGAPLRPGWCHGAAGVAGVLLRAGRALGRADVEAAAMRMLRDLPDGAASEPRVPGAAREPRVLDASFCHGAAGLAHVCNAAFQLTGAPELRQRAVRWLAALLQMRRPGAGIGGYCAPRLDGSAARWADDPTLLSGAVGVALVLRAAVEDRVPAWQRLFLL